MPEQYFLLTPLPQLTLHEKLSPLGLETGLSLCTFPPPLRRSLLNTVKKDSASDDLLRILLNSDTLFMVQVPQSGPIPSKPDISGTLYSVVAHELLHRLFNCLLLFDWVPAPLLYYPWFIVHGTADAPDFSSAKLLDPQWEYVDTFKNIDWRAPNVKPVNITLPVVGLREFWPKLRCLCQFDLLNSTFTDTARHRGYWQAAQKNLDKELLELMKARYGPDVVIDAPDDDLETQDSSPNTTSVDAPDSPRLLGPVVTAKWMLDGYRKAYMRAVGNLSTDLSAQPARNRFVRAFQFFCDAFRISEPHSYVAFSICLESLLCTRRSELAFQLGTRVAWLLSPADFEVRAQLVLATRELYGLRSTIVHGAHYSPDKLASSEESLIDLIRKIFCQILSDDYLWDIFNHKDQDACNNYLDSLNLGPTDRAV